MAQGTSSTANNTANNTAIETIADVNLEVVGLSPAIAMGYLYLATAGALARAAQDAVSAQQNVNTLAVTALANSLNVVVVRNPEVKGLY